ncbi:MAG: hypothetical protein ACPGRC_03645 [Salibacteraceae bacterium]
MKRGILFLIIAAVGFGFTSCDKIDEIENFAVDNKFEKSVDLNIGANDPTTFSKDIVIEASSDPDFQKNLSKISGYSVKKLTYRIASFTGDASITGTGEFTFYSGGVALGAPVELGVIQFQSFLESGEEKEIFISDNLKKEVQSKLLASNEITVNFNGGVSGNPIDAEIIVAMEIEAQVKVN